jgi:hypothetical protein
MLGVMRVTLLVVLLVLVAPMAVAEELFIPGVVQKEGSDGVWWNTEVWIANAAGSTGGFAVVFLPGDRLGNLEGVQGEPALEDIPPRATVYLNDVIPQGSFGALRVVVTPGVVVGARVFSAAGRSSSGHALPVLAREQAIRAGDVGHLVGLHRTPQFRTNVGLINPAIEACTVKVELVTRRGESVAEQEFKLAPGAVLVVNEALHAFGVKRGEHMRLELSGSGPFFAYSQTVDARSGAATIAVP